MSILISEGHVNYIIKFIFKVKYKITLPPSNPITPGIVKPIEHIAGNLSHVECSSPGRLHVCSAEATHPSSPLSGRENQTPAVETQPLAHQNSKCDLNLNFDCNERCGLQHFDQRVFKPPKHHNFGQKSIKPQICYSNTLLNLIYYPQNQNFFCTLLLGLLCLHRMTELSQQRLDRPGRRN